MGCLANWHYFLALTMALSLSLSLNLTVSALGLALLALKDHAARRQLVINQLALMGEPRPARNMIVYLNCAIN